MRISESKIRQIIKEEARRVLNESTRMTLGRLTADLNKAGEERLADRIGGRRPASHLDSAVRFRNLGDAVQVYFVSPEGTSQYIDDIPADVARELGIDAANESRRSRRPRHSRRLRESAFDDHELGDGDMGGMGDEEFEDDDGPGWSISENGYYLSSGDDVLDRAFNNFVRSLNVLEAHKNDSFYDPESRKEVTVDEMVLDSFRQAYVDP